MMSLTVEKNLRQLEEWQLSNLGRFVRFEVFENEWAEMVFEHETLIIGGEEDDRSNGELVAAIDSKPTERLTGVTDLELADFEMYTQGISLTLTNGDEYGLEISSNYDEFDDQSKIPWDLEVEYKIDFIYPNT